jgi:hypothetical protein
MPITRPVLDLVSSSIAFRIIRFAFVIPALCFLAPILASAATTSTSKADADAFVCTGSENNPVVISTSIFTTATDSHDLTSCNFGGAGTLAISSASSTKGEFQSLLRFNLASTVASFNSTYGVGNWTISSAQLKLRSNYGISGSQPNNAIFNTISGGKFGITWLSNDSWDEGTGNPSNPTSDGVTYDSLASLESSNTASLGLYTYTPPGSNTADYFYYNLSLSSDSFVSDLMTGSEVSFLFYAADDNIAMLFNSITKQGYEPYIVITADIVPEPSTLALLLLGAAASGLFFARQKSHGLSAA